METFTRQPAGQMPETFAAELWGENNELKIPTR